jgi:glycosyltransferase involved in cell wall biosynthesis
VLSFDGTPSALFVDASNTNEFSRTVSIALDNQDVRNSLQQSGGHLKRLYSVDKMAEDYERILAQVV